MENRSNNKGIVPLIIGCIIFLAADYFGLWYFLVRVSPKFEETTIELGCEEVSLDADDYLTGLHIFHSDAWVDTSDLNRYVEGTYTVVVYLTDKEYEYTYYVEDTCSPRLEINESFDDCLELGDNYVSAIDRCFDFIYDPSGIVDATLYVDGAEAGTGSITTSGYYTGDEKYVQYARIEESLYENIEGTFDELRSYEISLVVVDGAGNKEGADYTVDVKDTRAPQITTFDEEEQPWFAIGRRYRPEDFVKEIDDASGFWSTAFIIDEEPSAYIEFDDMGEHEVTVYAVDESGNETRLDVTAPFDEPPIFVAVRNRDVLLDSDYDILYHVIAVDNTDGDVTATITVDDDGFDPCKIGTYNVKYTATDSHGLQTEIISELDVGYNYAGDFYLTDEEIDLLCDYDYFEYDILEEEDYNQAIDLIEPAQVNMIYRYSTAYSSGYTAGSGFIYRIDDDYTYIVSCKHVFEEFDGSVELMFCDDKATEITIQKPHFLQMSPENEVAMIRIPTDDIPADVLVELKEINADEDVYSSLNRGQTVVAYSGHWLNDKPKIGKMEIQSLDEYFTDDAVNCVKTTHDVRAGMSGGSVCDLYGRLIGVVEGYISLWNYDIGDYDYSAYQLRIVGLEDLYKRLAAGE